MSLATAGRYGFLTMPDGRVIARPKWSPDPEIMDSWVTELRGRFFLVRIGGNTGLGEVWRCRRCKGRHMYLTASCIERPFNGLDGAVYAIYQQAGDLAAVQSFTPSPSHAHAVARAIVRQVMELPDLSTAHPGLARQQGAALSRFDVQVGGMRLGRVEEIPRTLAQRLIDRINQSRQSGGKLHVDGLEVR